MSQPLRLDSNMESEESGRRLITRACDTCRKKKIRCEPVSDACAQCIKSKTPCHFTQISVLRSRRRVSRDRRVEELEKRLAWMEGQLRLPLEGRQFPDFSFNQLDSTEATISHSSVDSRGGEFAHILPNEIDKTPDSSSTNLFDFCNSQTCSNTPSLASEAWCRSTNMSNPESISGTVHSEPNIVGDRWIGSLQQDKSDGNSMDIERQGNLASFNGSHDLSGIGENWSESNIFVPESHRPVIQPVLHDPMKSASAGIDGAVEKESSVTAVASPPTRSDNGMQQPSQFDQAQLYTLITELKSQLHEIRKDATQEQPGLGRRPLTERSDLVTLMEQCLTTLREPTTHMSGDKGDKTRREEREPATRHEAELDQGTPVRQVCCGSS